MFDYAIQLGENFQITIGQILLAVLLIASTQFVLKKLKKYVEGNKGEKNSLLPKTLRYARIAIICLTIILLVQLFKIDDLIDGIQGALEDTKPRLFRISNTLWLFLVFLLARLADNFLAEYLKSKNTSTSHSTVSGVQYFVWLLLGGLILGQTSFDVNINPVGDGTNSIMISELMWAIMTLIGAHILSSLVIHVILDRYYSINQIEEGAQYALNTLLRYFIYMIAAIIAIQQLGFDANAIWGALAGAAIVVGLGIQQVLNDFASGILLLFERSIVVGNVIQVDGIIGKVSRIGIRASIIKTREDTNLIIPNSHLVSNNVVNWNFGRARVKFAIPVGVAYGSDTKQVESILLQSLEGNKSVLLKPAPFVWFKSFDDSSLLFEVHYWSTYLMQEDNVKSAIRFEIDKLFREAGIEIPFPQRVVHLEPKSNK
jgi:small-conductance mechanosensitive channel